MTTYECKLCQDKVVLYSPTNEYGIIVGVKFNKRTTGRVLVIFEGEQYPRLVHPEYLSTTLKNKEVE